MDLPPKRRHLPLPEDTLWRTWINDGLNELTEKLRNWSNGNWSPGVDLENEKFTKTPNQDKSVKGKIYILHINKAILKMGTVQVFSQISHLTFRESQAYEVSNVQRFRTREQRDDCDLHVQNRDPYVSLREQLDVPNLCTNWHLQQTPSDGQKYWNSEAYKITIALRCQSRQNLLQHANSLLTLNIQMLAIEKDWYRGALPFITFLIAG